MSAQPKRDGATSPWRHDLNLAGTPVYAGQHKKAAPVVYASADCAELHDAVAEAIQAARANPSKYKHTAPGLFLTPEKRRSDAAKLLRAHGERGPYSKDSAANAPVVHEKPCLCGCGAEVVGARSKQYATPQCKARHRASWRLKIKAEAYSPASREA